MKNTQKFGDLEEHKKLGTFSFAKSSNGKKRNQQIVKNTELNRNAKAPNQHKFKVTKY